MAGVFGDYSQLFRLFHASVIKRFVRRENPERELQLKKKKFSDTSGEEEFGGDRKFGYRRLKTLMQDKEENKVKSFTGFNRTCRLESC